MTLTDAKEKFSLSDVGIRLIINTSLKEGEDYFMDTVGQRRIFYFTQLGEKKLPKLIGTIGMEDTLCLK